jgi:hypothetical protein
VALLRIPLTLVVAMLALLVGAPPSGAVGTVSLFDAQWMGLTPDQPPGWQEMNRRITADFQQFSFRPDGETELPMRCNGCAPWTVTLTAFTPGAFDPADARSGTPVTVNVEGDGFLTERPAEREATLTWRYADDAWATVRGRTSQTTEPVRMVELARALRPDARVPIRLPVSLANVPAHMPLAQIDVSKDRYGTRVDFAPCGRTVDGATEPCMTAGDSMSVQILPGVDRGRHILVEDAVPMSIGGYDGLYNPGGVASGEQAQVQVGSDVLVVFEGDRMLGDVLAGVSFAPDPANRDTWAAVSDWAG